MNFTLMFMEIGNLSEYDKSDLDIVTKMREMCIHAENAMTADLEETLAERYPEYMYPNSFLKKYVPPVLLSLGTFGNLLSFIIMARSMLRVSTYSYLAVLAVMDILVLYVGLLRMWIGHFSIDVQLTSNLLCKLINFLGYVSSDTSVWLIIAVTIERFIAVKCPLRAPRMCNAFRARFVIIGVIILICSINAHIMWTVELHYSTINGSSLVKCEASEKHKVLVKDIWPWVDAAIYSFVPFVIITILNSLIVRQVLQARKRRSQMQHVELTAMYCSFASKHQRKKSNENNKKLTFMLLAVSFTFLLTTLPMNVQLIVSAFYGSLADNPKGYAQMTLARTVVELLMYVNHSINFFLYCATGKKFRRQVRDLICLCCKGKLAQFFRRQKRQTSTSTTLSYRLSKMNSSSSPKSLIIECDKKFFAGKVVK